MQFTDKHEKAAPTSGHWRKKVSPIPSFLHQSEDHFSLPSEEKDTGSLLMKGILYTILTATLGVIVGYVISFLMRAPSSTQEYDKAISNVNMQLASIMGGTKAPGADAAGKKDSKTDTSAGANNKTTTPTVAIAPNVQPSTQPSPAGSAVAPAAPATPTLPKEASVKPTAPDSKPTEKPKDVAKTPKKPIPQGPVYFGSTNAYGPPPMLEEELFSPDTLLKVEQDPSNPQPTVGYEATHNQPHNFQELIQDPLPKPAATVMENDGPTSGFQVQFGAFNSKTNAIQFANRLQEKGYGIGIYEGWTRARGSWYYVRLDRMLDHTGALEIAKNIQANEKFLPMVVQPTAQEKKLR